MRVTLLMVVLLVGAVAVSAQDAKVIELKPSEAQDLKAKHDALVKAQKAYDDAADSVRKKYTLSDPSQRDKQTFTFSYCTVGDKGTECPLAGWDHGINFSPDFRFIVPKEAPASQGFANPMLNCFTPTPAIQLNSRSQ